MSITRKNILSALDGGGLEPALNMLAKSKKHNRLARHFQAWCAEKVLHIWEKTNPNKNSVRMQIETLKNDQASNAERARARLHAAISAWFAVGAFKNSEAEARLHRLGWPALGIGVFPFDGPNAAAKAAASRTSKLYVASCDAVRAESCMALRRAAEHSGCENVLWKAINESAYLAIEAQEAQLRKMLGDCTYGH